MSGAKHTPGPWDFPVGVTGTSSCVLPISAVDPTGTSDSGRVTVATAWRPEDARLIAAAPDAHAILVEIHEFFRHWNPVDPSTMFDETSTFKQAVEAYLAKAGGA